ncbi:hypothetical protein [Nocardia sp. NPDC049149]|uniref:hypothetical protein n=1 Tax=Nocardia sp. NPDC049149 TaxID=3364315 RepID=UPI003711442C
MTTNATFVLSGAGLKLTFATESDELTLDLDDTYAPFQGTHQLQSKDTDAGSPGIQLTGSLRHQSVGRGGPIVRTAQVSVFLPDAPDQGSAGTASGALVLAASDSEYDTAPQYYAVALTGTVNAPGGRF